MPWAGKDNSISCAAGHHLYEGRWLRDPQYMADYARFWFRGGGEPRRYSFWAADSVRAVTLATGDTTLARRICCRIWSAITRRGNETHRDATGLFHQSDDRDGMEYSLGGSGYRPTINAYQYGDARAIAAIAEQAGQADLARQYRAKAAEIKRLVQAHLWNAHDQFFETAPEAASAADIKTVGVREQIGFVPWYFDLPDAGHEAAWKQLLDPQGFAAPYGPTTAERRAPGFMHPEPHDCLWNGPSLALCDDADAGGDGEPAERLPPVGDRQGGLPAAAPDLRPFAAAGRQALGRGGPGRRHGQMDRGPAALDLLQPFRLRRPRHHRSGRPAPARRQPGRRQSTGPGRGLGLVLPGRRCPYHGHDLTVLWDRTGAHYGHGKGLAVFCDGRLLAASA